MTDELTADQKKRIIQYARDGLFADLFGLMIGLAAETHPDIVRKALANVFDLATVEDATTRMMSILASVQAQAQQCRELLAAIHLDIEALEQRLDAANFVIERTQSR